jgi:hypothetical protein
MGLLVVHQATVYGVFCGMQPSRRCGVQLHGEYSSLRIAAPLVKPEDVFVLAKRLAERGNVFIVVAFAHGSGQGNPTFR